MPAPVPAIVDNPTLAVEKAFVAYLLEQPLLASGIDIVAASDRSVLVGPLHAFALCVEFAPIIPAGPQGIATVAIGVVTDMDEHGEAVRADYFSRVSTALTATQYYDGDDATLQGWSIKSTKDQSDGRKVMDVMVLRVGATV
ncbi:MAG: hypothetical protein RIQ79_1514 [Verrucomicrobiota bacterium]|jgi:hypothetical protein